MKSQIFKTIVNRGWTKSLFAAILFTQIGHAQAGVIVTPATNGNGISADLSMPSRQTAFTPIGDIVISEQQTQDFAFTDRYWRTMILTAPDGWEFNPGVGKITMNAPSDFRVTDLKVKEHTITLRFCVRSTELLDVMTISGIEVRAVNGMIQTGNAYIHRSVNNPGTALVSNITPTRNTSGSGGTNFASLSLKPGKAQKLIFANKPYSTAEGKNLEGQTEIMTVDQFGNFSTEGLAAIQNVRVRLSSANSSLTGQTVLNIGTLGGNGRVTFSDLQVHETGMRKMIASAPSLSFAVTGDFLIYDDGVEAPAQGLDADMMCVQMAK